MVIFSKYFFNISIPELERVNYEFVNGILNTRYDVDGDSYQVSVEYPSAARIKTGSSLKVELIPEDSAEYQEYLKQAEAALSDPNQTVKKARFFDITILDPNGKEIEPAAAVKVNIELAPVDTSGNNGVELIHFAGDGQNEVVKDVDLQKTDKDTVEGMQFETDGFSVFGVVETETLTTEVITAKGETFEITVTYGADAEIPEGASLTASEISNDSDEYIEFMEKALAALNSSDDDTALLDISNARFFDVKILSDGVEVEPAAAVTVSIVYEDPFVIEKPEDLRVVHFAGTGTEIIEVDNDTNEIQEIQYEQNSFSVIGTIAVTNANNWPTSNGQYVVVLQDGENYYAVSQDGTLRRVKYFNNTISFVGEGTTTVEYINDYLWHFTSSGTTRGYISTESGTTGNGTFIDPSSENGLSNSHRQLRTQNGMIYSTNYVDGNVVYYSVSASQGDGGKISQTGLYDNNASPIFFAPLSSFTANDNESEMYTQIDVDALIEKWRRQMTQELTTNKTAEVYDYDNRIYQIDIEASSGYYEVSPSIALEFVVDSSRSMYFPSTMTKVADYTSTSGWGTNYGDGLRNWLNDHGDHQQTYFTITDPNGAATVYALYWSHNEWYYVDASNYNPPDDSSNGGNKNTKYVGTPLSGWNPSNLNKELYTTELTSVTSDNTYGTRGKYVSRIEYLKLAVSAAAQVVYAVDGDAQIGLVSFNAEAKDWGTFGKEDKEDFFAALDSISLAGGTNQRKGLELVIEKYRALENKDHQQVVVLVTDGAPNGDANWTNIGQAATTLKNLKDKYGHNTVLYTMGLSLEHVGTNKDSLFGISSGEGYKYNAEDAAAIVDCITKIIENIVIEANLTGDVVDVIDQVFYPVDENGVPFSSGDWITINGEKTSAGASNAVGQLSYDAPSDVWTVRWNDQLLEWPTTDGNGTILTPGWHGRIYVKSKEDFLGGNGINTNSTGSKIVAEEYIDHAGEHIPLTSPETERTEMLATPYVNIDELAFTENSTEWTVYLGTEVDPLKEIQDLWSRIMVQEVVSKTDEDHTIASDGSMTYDLAPGSTADGREVKNPREEFALSTLSSVDWDNLLEDGHLDVPYYAYGHNDVGSIRITLTQNTVEGETDLTESPHETTVVAAPAETYKLTVQYIPSDSEIPNYHTGSYGTQRPGNDTDEIKSENTHIINVFAKGMQITKTDESFNRELIGAKFVLYRTDRKDDDPSKVTTIDGAVGNYFPVAELDLSQSAVGTIDPVEKLASGEQYYLVETVAPESHNLLDHPLPVTLTITDSFVPKPGTDSQDTRPTSGIYDWTQTAVLNLGDGDSAVKRTDENNTTDLTHTAIIADSENAILYFRIANTGGYVLPEAGGPGTLLYTLSGLAMIVTALMYGFRLRRRERRVNG